MGKTFFVLSFILFLSSGSVAICQEVGIEMTHRNRNRVRVVKEGQRVKVRTLNGDKFKGRFTVLDENTIRINEETVALDDIKSIRRKPLAVKIVKGVFIGVGVLAIGVPILVGADGLAIFLTSILGSYSALAGLTIPEFFVQTRKISKWSYAVTPLNK